MPDRLSDNPPLKKGISRRNFLIVGGVGAAVVGGGKLALDVLKPFEPKELPDTSPIGWGFNTHLEPFPADPNQNMTIDTFKRSVDLMVEHKNTWIRFDMMPWHVADLGPQGELLFKERDLEVYREGIRYAHDRGLKVFVAQDVPDFANEMDWENFRRTSKEYFSGLAERFKGEIDVWQIFNEADIHHFRWYDARPDIQHPTYLPELHDLIADARGVIKEQDPNALITTNMVYGPWIREYGFHRKLELFFDQLAPELDLITINLYPGHDRSEIERLPEYIASVEERYRKPVVVGELGLPTRGEYSYSEAEQAYYLRAYVASLGSGRVRPEAVLIYELTDESSKDLREGSFGLTSADGTSKPAFTEAMQFIVSDVEAHEQTATSPSPTETPTR